tara:strand:+ start:172 stop:1182 length:1011 start_codon:yes stop_codon:yes gene_type:complete
LILGSNGVGKSNLLESVEFLSQLKSFRAVNDKELINNDSEHAIILAQIDFNQHLKIELFRQGSKRVYLNDSLLRKQSLIRRYLRSVCFSSNDINIIKGEPNYRRIWLDKVVAQLEPVYVDLLGRYNKLIKQRSHYWRSKHSQSYSSEMLIDSYDSQIALVGTRILRRRKRALSKLQPYILNWHSYLSRSRENIRLQYISSLNISEDNDDEKEIMRLFHKELVAQRNLEEITGKCSVGPHRDDIEFFINNASVRKFGSSGQQRTLTLALKMAELDLLRKTIQINPILILDDVLAELDVVRQNLLLNVVGSDSQCFISATHLDKFHRSFVDNSQIIYL